MKLNLIDYKYAVYEGQMRCLCNADVVIALYPFDASFNCLVCEECFIRALAW